MTLQEFESRTGLTITADNFDYINRIYMAAHDLEKDSFCEEFKGGKRVQLQESSVVAALVLEVEQQDGHIKDLQRQVERDQKGLQAFTNQMVDFLILQAHKWSATDLRERAIKLVGIREYLRRVIEMKLDFWKADLEVLTEILEAE